MVSGRGGGASPGVADACPTARSASGRPTLGQGRAPHRGFHQQAPGSRRVIATRRGSAASVACENGLRQETRRCVDQAEMAAALVLAVVVLVAGGCTRAAERPPPEDPRRPTITVTSFDFPESETLAELYGQALRQQGAVEVVARLGPRDIVQPALEQGRVDLVLGYLGSTLNFLYEQRVATADPQATHARLTQLLTSRGISVLACQGRGPQRLCRHW